MSTRVVNRVMMVASPSRPEETFNEEDLGRGGETSTVDISVYFELSVFFGLAGRAYPRTEIAKHEQEDSKVGALQEAPAGQGDQKDPGHRADEDAGRTVASPRTDRVVDRPAQHQ